MEKQRFRSFRRRHHNMPKPPLAERAKEHCRQFTAFMFSNVGIIILVVVYMTSGKFECKRTVNSTCVYFSLFQSNVGVSSYYYSAHNSYALITIFVNLHNWSDFLRIFGGMVNWLGKKPFSQTFSNRLY